MSLLAHLALPYTKACALAYGDARAELYSGKQLTSVSTLKNLRYRLMFRNQYFLLGSSSPLPPPAEWVEPCVRPLFSEYDPTACSPLLSNMHCAKGLC